MYINEKVTYTPQIITITNDTPIQATVTAVGPDTLLTLLLPDGSEVTVDKAQCVPVEISVDGNEGNAL